MECIFVSEMVIFIFFNDCFCFTELFVLAIYTVFPIRNDEKTCCNLRYLDAGNRKKINQFR